MTVTTAISPSRYGAVEYLPNDCWMGRCLELYGEWSECEVALWRKVLKPGDIVIDAGANIGTHSLALATLVGETGKVYAFEPQEVIADILYRNIARNGWGATVDVSRLALGRREELGEYLAPDYAQGGNFGDVTVRPSSRGDHPPVWIATVDGLMLNWLTMLKADVEGAELDLLGGALLTVRDCRPILYLENDRGQKLGKWLARERYRWYRHEPPLFNPENWAGNPENVLGHAVSRNLIALPVERHDELFALIEGDPFLYDP